MGRFTITRELKTDNQNEVKMTNQQDIDDLIELNSISGNNNTVDKDLIMFN